MGRGEKGGNKMTKNASRSFPLANDGNVHLYYYQRETSGRARNYGVCVSSLFCSLVVERIFHFRSGVRLPIAVALEEENRGEMEARKRERRRSVDRM